MTAIRAAPFPPADRTSGLMMELILWLGRDAGQLMLRRSASFGYIFSGISQDVRSLLQGADAETLRFRSKIIFAANLVQGFVRELVSCLPLPIILGQKQDPARSKRRGNRLIGQYGADPPPFR
ncbi:hypothetical protein [Methylocapsa aurea]|uniref:hypothetical protein n=1 Tax=Methylocapsa aurea TaxID=663610 RepID=UPI000561D98E|nr:hypothetical protein [Methylocapsa aurea]